MARVTVTDTAAEATDLAAERLADAIAAGRRQGRTVHLSLAGGTTPRAAYERLAALVDDWEGVELWLGDERLVPPDDPESNYRLLAETLLRGTGALAHAVPTGGSAEEAASAYASEIRRRVPAGRTACPRSTSRSWASARTATPPRSSPTPRRWTPGARSASRCTTRPSRRPTGSA